MSWIDTFQSYLPSTKWPAVVRKPLRFMLIGGIGTFVQTGFFLLLMILLHQPEQNTMLYYIAFAGGFILEMIPNYCCTNFYTFGTVPTWKNAGGFVLARGINLVLQMVILPLSIHWLPTIPDAILSPIVIFIAGIVNFLIQLLFFKEKSKDINN